MNKIQSDMEELRLHFAELRSKGYWFAAKRFGWGWTPISWQGWISIIIYILLLSRDVLNTTSYVNNVSQSTGDVVLFFAPSFILYTALFLMLTHAKGEKPYWNWSIKPKKRDE